MGDGGMMLEKGSDRLFQPPFKGVDIDDPFSGSYQGGKDLLFAFEKGVIILPGASIDIFLPQSLRAEGGIILPDLFVSRPDDVEFEVGKFFPVMPVFRQLKLGLLEEDPLEIDQFQL